MPRSRKAIVYWYHDGEEYEAEISVGPVSYEPHEYGQRDVELIDVRDHAGPRPDLIDAIPNADLEQLYSEAIERVSY